MTTRVARGTIEVTSQLKTALPPAQPRPRQGLLFMHLRMVPGCPTQGHRPPTEKVGRGGDGGRGEEGPRWGQGTPAALRGSAVHATGFWRHRLGSGASSLRKPGGRELALPGVTCD